MDGQRREEYTVLAVRQTPWRRFVTGGIAAVVLAISLLEGGSAVHPSVLEHPWLTLAALAVGVGVARRGSFRDLPGRIVYGPSDRRFRAALFLLATASFAAGSWSLFGAIPRLDDSVASLFQARIFARGAVSLPLPPDPGFFELFGVLGPDGTVPHWVGMYPPGWPALLVPGVWLGAPWLVNPVLGGVLALAVTALGKELHGERVGRTAGCLTLLSPFVVVLASTHLSHVATAAGCALFFWALLRLIRTHRVGYGVVAGVAWGVAFLCRPLTSLVVGLAVGLPLLGSFRDLLRAWRGALLAISLAMTAVATLLAFQSATTGDPFVPGHRLGLGDRARWGFVRLDAARTHTVELGVTYTLRRMRVLEDRLFGWPLPNLIPALVPFFLGRVRREDLILFGSFLALLLVFSAFWYWESYFPARYVFASVPGLLVLSAWGLHSIHDVARRRGGWAPSVFACVVVASIVFAATAAIPDYLREHDPDFGDVESTLPRVIEAYGVHDAIVFMDATEQCDIRGDRHNDFYATGFMRNDLDLQADVLFARNSRRQNLRLMRRYPGRSYYLYRYLRCSRKALLYRMFDEGDSIRLEPVRPKGPGLLEDSPESPS